MVENTTLVIETVGERVTRTKAYLMIWVSKKFRATEVESNDFGTYILGLIT